MIGSILKLSMWRGLIKHTLTVMRCCSISTPVIYHRHFVSSMPKNVLLVSKCSYGCFFKETTDSNVVNAVNCRHLTRQCNVTLDCCALSNTLTYLLTYINWQYATTSWRYITATSLQPTYTRKIYITAISNTHWTTTNWNISADKLPTILVLYRPLAAFKS